MTDHDIVRELYALRRFAARPGLYRMRRLLDEGGWWTAVDAVKITGSNGKGTVATLTAAILKECGLRVGLYTSPHLRQFSERIRIDGEPVDRVSLAEAMAWLRPRLDPPLALEDDPPLTFEAVTALALRIFEQHHVDVVVAEAGMGGRHDPTRLLSGTTNVLVSVDLEHTAVLGETLEAIALDKADLADDGSLLLVGDLPGAVQRAVEASCGRRGVRVQAAPVAAGLGAEHRRRNEALAITAAEHWLAVNRPEAEPRKTARAARRVCETVQLPGRLERVCDHPETWIDIAHSPGALRAVAEAMAALDSRPVLLVFGLSQDKEPKALAMVEAIKGSVDRVICSRAGHRPGNIDVVVAAARQAGLPCERQESLADALERATAQALAEDMRILVTGSLFLAIEAAEINAGHDPKALEFY